MIIKITFHDNDFSEFLDQLADTIDCHRFTLVGTLEDEVISTDMKFRDAWNTLIDPRTENLDDNTYKSCLVILHRYIEEYIEEDDEYFDDLSYLMQNLSIEFCNNYESKRENGEVLYIFLKGDHTWLIQ